MDKRKVSRASPTPDSDDRARKRRKQSSLDLNTPAAVAQALYDTVWNHQERNRFIRQHFEKLVPQSDYPDYYQKIKKPISLAEIQGKIHKNEYASLADVEADFLLMCQNAASYNKPKSQVHSDSVRVRNVVEGFVAEQSTRHVKRDEEPPYGRGTSGRSAKTSQAALQQAQMLIVDDLLTLADERGELVAHYFVNLPSKKLYGEYFRIIKQPVSLNMIKKKISLGEYPSWSAFEKVVTLIRKNAEEFNAEGSDIIKDARVLESHFYKILNEQKSKLGNSENGGSGIKLRFNVNAHSPQQEQKDSPPAQKGPRIKLNLGNRQNTAANATLAPPLPPPPPSQQVQQPTRTPKKPPVNGHPRTARTALEVGPNPNTNPPVVPQVNGTSSAKGQVNDVSADLPQTPIQAPTPLTPTPSLPPLPSSSSIQSLLVPVPALESNRTSQSPNPDIRYNPTPAGRSISPAGDSITLRARSAPRTPQPQTSPPIPNLAMPPPPQRHSATPAPTPGPSSYSSAAPLNVPVPIPPVLHHPRPNMGFEEPRYRAEGKDASSALISSLRLTSAAAIGPDLKFLQDLAPDDRKVTSQFSIHLPAETHTIVVIPTLSIANLQNRPYKLNVEHKVNNNAPRTLGPLTSLQKKKEELPFEVRLNADSVNTIECTLVTPAHQSGVNGVTIGSSTQGNWDMERFRVFISLLPA